MGWTAPRDWTTGEVVTEAMMDTHVKNNLRYLKGLDGVPTIESGLIIDNTSGDEYLQIPSLTTVERDALTPVNGMIIYNETTTEFNKYEAGAWVDLADNTDHGGLDGLADDDHTQYQKESLLTTAGDLPYATAASTWQRLGIGTIGHILSVAAGGTAPEWRAETARTNKLLSHTRDMTAAGGAVAYTGYGFQPTSLIIFHGGAGFSIGVGDVNLAEMCLWQLTTGGTIEVDTALIFKYSSSSGITEQTAVLTTLDADGFTLTWTKTGSPTGTRTFFVLALR